MREGSEGTRWSIELYPRCGPLYASETSSSRDANTANPSNGGRFIQMWRFADWELQDPNSIKQARSGIAAND
jgi:hypothetical protein